MPVILDLDYRPYTWPSPADAGQVCLKAARLCDMIVGNDEESPHWVEMLRQVENWPENWPTAGW